MTIISFVGPILEMFDGWFDSQLRRSCLLGFLSPAHQKLEQRKRYNGREEFLAEATLSIKMIIETIRKILKLFFLT